MARKRTKIRVPFWTYEELGDSALAGKGLPRHTLPLLVDGPDHPMLAPCICAVHLTSPHSVSLLDLADFQWHGIGGDFARMHGVRHPGDLGIPGEFRFRRRPDAFAFLDRFDGRLFELTPRPIDPAYIDAWKRRPGYEAGLRRSGHGVA